MTDETHDKARQSWVASANGHSEFPLQNLPFGVFSPPRPTAPAAAPRGGVAIGDMLFDLRAAHDSGLFSGEAATGAEAASGGTLNPLMALGSGPRRALRQQVFALLAADGAGRAKLEPVADKLLHRASDCWLHLPAAIGNFTDFFAGIHHARNGGRRRDPNNPLSSNYKYVPVAYHSRASSLRESGIAVRRPAGQYMAPNETTPRYGPCRNFDIELEALLLTPQMREKALEPHRMSRSNTLDLYWTVAQLVAHHTCGGCNLLPGDIFGSGTISGQTEEGWGSLNELSHAGQRTITLHTRETRTYLQDGDEVIFRAHCRRDGYAPIGFGESRARVVG